MATVPASRSAERAHKKAAFVLAIQDTSSVQQALERSGIMRRTFNRWLLSDPEFAALVDQAGSQSLRICPECDYELPWRSPANAKFHPQCFMVYRKRYKSQWTQGHRQQARAYSRTWKERNLPKRFERLCGVCGKPVPQWSRAPAKFHPICLPVHRRQYRSDWYAGHKEQARGYSFRSRRRRKDKVREYGRLYRQNNPEVIATIKTRRRSKTKDLQPIPRGWFSQQLFDQGNRCAGCGSRFGERRKPEIDHIVSIALNGDNHPSNLQLMCRRCNASKGARPEGEWRRSLGCLL